MNPSEDPLDSIDWSLTTWEGSRREQLRRWSELTFDEILRAQEEMAEIAELQGHPTEATEPPAPFSSKRAFEQ